VVDRPKALLNVEVEAAKLLGDYASNWLARPSRLLDGMMPAELATSPEGARVVLHELKHAITPLRAERLKKRA